MIGESFDITQELDRRSNDGIDVVLAWSPSSGRVAVTVSDSKTGSDFVIDVRADEAPLDVFRHPFAYAAWRRIPTDVTASSGSNRSRSAIAVAQA